MHQTPARTNENEPQKRTHVVKLISGDRFELTAQQVHDLYEAKRRGDEWFISPNTMENIPLKPAPIVVTIERDKATDHDKLARAGRWRCKYGQVHEKNERCYCSVETVKQQPFAPHIHPAVRAKMIESAGGKDAAALIESGTQPTYEDMVEARVATGEKRARGMLKKK